MGWPALPEVIQLGFTSVSEEAGMAVVAVLGIDLGKNSCSVAGLDDVGRVVVRRRVVRDGLADFLDKPAALRRGDGGVLRSAPRRAVGGGDWSPGNAADDAVCRSRRRYSLMSRHCTAPVNLWLPKEQNLSTIYVPCCSSAASSCRNVAMRWRTGSMNLLPTETKAHSAHACGCW